MILMISFILITIVILLFFTDNSIKLKILLFKWKRLVKEVSFLAGLTIDKLKMLLTGLITCSLCRYPIPSLHKHDTAQVNWYAKLDY